jgi:hypothetical protein
MNRDPTSRTSRGRSRLAVDCSTGDLESTVRLTNNTTLEGSTLLEATSYNGYRGELPGLADGYGTCQNSRDADLTDTTFVDYGRSYGGQVGFHYLVSCTSNGMEQGLGYRSDGSARTAGALCP